MCPVTRLCALAMLFALGDVAAAPKTWVVDVGGTMMSGGGYGGYGGGTSPKLAFSPKAITINAGDSITFVNLGGASHNVHADDNSFRCANGCDDQGGNGSPSSAEWEFTRTFPTPGTIAYHCDNHLKIGRAHV